MKLIEISLNKINDKVLKPDMLPLMGDVKVQKLEGSFITQSIDSVRVAETLAHVLILRQLSLLFNCEFSYRDCEMWTVGEMKWVKGEGIGLNNQMLSGDFCLVKKT